MRLNLLLLQLITTCVALVLQNVHGSEECLRTLTSRCEDGKTACIKDCYGRGVDDLEYIEAEDAQEETEDLSPAIDLDGDAALGIAVEYASSDERLVIEKLPKFTRWLYISNLHLSTEHPPLVIPGSTAKLRNVYLTGEEIASLARVTFPDSVKLLSVFQTSLTTLSDASFPPKLNALYATESAITAICSTKFPSTLTLLDLHINALSSLDGVHLPESLQSLDLSSNKLQHLADFTFPSALEQLNLDNNGLSEISNVTFPSAAEGASISLRKNAIRSIRLTSPQWDAFASAFKDSKDLVLDTRPTNVAQCTIGHYGQEKPTEFSACLLEE